MPEGRAKLHDNSMFWIAVAAVAGFIGVFLWSTTHNDMQKTHVTNLQMAAFALGILLIVGAVLALGWSIVLHLAHRHAEKHMCPDPSAHGVYLSGQMQPTGLQLSPSPAAVALEIPAAEATAVTNTPPATQALEPTSQAPVAPQPPDSPELATGVVPHGSTPPEGS